MKHNLLWLYLWFTNPRLAWVIWRINRREKEKWGNTEYWHRY